VIQVSKPSLNPDPQSPSPFELLYKTSSF